MPILKYQFKSHGSRGRWFSQKFKTYNELNKSKKFLGKEARIKVEGRNPQRVIRKRIPLILKPTRRLWR